jgi:large subunit ribosomal protein L25
MAKQVALEAEVRDGLGKEKAKKLRLKGLIPAEFYGKGAGNLHLVVQARGFEKALKGSESRKNTIFELAIKDKSGKTQKEIVLLRENQQDPITDQYVHLDFLKIDTKHPISVKVPIRLVGDCPAVKEGLMLAQVLHELPVKCLPLEIPVHIDIDVTVLKKAHDAVHVGDLKLPDITIELPVGQEIVHAEVPRELKVVEETPAEVSAEVPTTVQGKAEEGAAPAEGAKPGEAAKKPEAAKPGEAKAAPAKPEAKK